LHVEPPITFTGVRPNGPHTVVREWRDIKAKSGCFWGERDPPAPRGGFSGKGLAKLKNTVLAAGHHLQGLRAFFRPVAFMARAEPAISNAVDPIY
jgi:hypothetical protein